MYEASPPGLETLKPLQVLQQKDTNIQALVFKNQARQLPIPKGYSPYCMAKRAEYLEKDLQSAQYYYELSIQSNDRLPSAVKDLAGVLHQQGKTAQAVKLLENYKHVFKNDMKKLENLLNSLKKQVQPTGNAANKFVKISNFQLTETELYDLFQNVEKIIAVEINQEQQVAVVKFNSHSSARKAMDQFKGWENKVFKIEWMTSQGEVTSNVIPPKKVKQRELLKKQQLLEQNGQPPKFSYLFAFEKETSPYLIPVDEDIIMESIDYQQEYEEFKFLGYDLVAFINSPEILGLSKKFKFIPPV